MIEDVSESSSSSIVYLYSLSIQFLRIQSKAIPCPIQNLNDLSVLVVDNNPYIQRKKQIEVVMIDIDCLQSFRIGLITMSSDRSMVYEISKVLVFKINHSPNLIKLLVH
ncbi:hypothetical protein ACTFIV_000099 [Dictyostelium citrinum]